MLGTAYFARLLDITAAAPLAVAAYNAGAGNVNKWLASQWRPAHRRVDVVNWIEEIPFFETRNYVQRVIENAVVYDTINPNRSSAPARPASPGISARPVARAEVTGARGFDRATA